MNVETILEKEGRVWFRNTLESAELDLLATVADLKMAIGSRIDPSGLSPEAAKVFAKIDAIARQLKPNVKPVRLIAFNKTSKTNWGLPWHQDRVIAVGDKHAIFGFENWSQKKGVWHCEPPTDLLDKMMFARVHLDDSDESNGCLELALGSHRHGKILSKSVESVIENSEHETCIAKRGDIVFVKALTLHRSHPSQSTSPRKAMRIDYSNQVLPSPLRWSF